MYRKATAEEIKKIKAGDFFLVEFENGTIAKFEADDDASFDCKWGVYVAGYIQDADGDYYPCEGVVFDEGKIVVEI